MSPLPENYSLPTSEKKDFPLLPDDTYEVKITQIELKEKQPVYNQPDQFEDKLAFQYEVVEEGEFKGRKIFQDVRTIMGAGSSGFSPSWLYRIFCAVNKVVLNDQEAQSVSASSINEMVGKRLRLVVKQKEGQSGKKRNKVTDVLPVKSSGVISSLTEPTPIMTDEALRQRDEDAEISPEDIPF